MVIWKYRFQTYNYLYIFQWQKYWDSASSCDLIKQTQLLKYLCLTVYCGDILFCWRSVFIQATTECYIPLESVWRWDFKKVKVRPSIRLSVCPFATLTKKNYSSFIIDSRKIICISGERAYHPLQENEEIFS